MLKEFIDWILYSLIGLDSSGSLVQALNFFIYDSVKIILLLFVMISVIGFFRTYISDKKLKKIMGKRKSIFSNFIASVFGAVTPFCSCSSIPLFLSFIKARIPLGISFSFLITSPIVNEYLVVLMLGFFGIKITAAYVIFGILVGTIMGYVLGMLNLEKHLEKDITGDAELKEKKYSDLKGRFAYGLSEAKSIVKKLWLWILVGVGIGALIHNFVPQSFVELIMTKGGIFTVPLAVILGVPIYANCAAIVPVALALFEKGISLGTALAFMMATSALSLPEAIILRKAMKLRMIAIFFGIVALSMVVIGYLFNILQIYL